MGGGGAVIGEQDGGVILSRNLAAFHEHAVRAHGVDGGVIGSGVVVEDVATVVDDRVARAFDPVSGRGRSRSLQVSLGGGVVAFDEEDVGLIGSVGAVGLPDLFESASVCLLYTSDAADE